MKSLLAVAGLELRGRARLLFVAPLAGMVAAAVALAVPALRGDALGAVVSLAWCSWAAALLLGWSMTSSDLAERRAGFWFSRPIAGASIWGGRLLGAYALLLGACALAVAPVLVARGLAAAVGVGSMHVDASGDLASSARVLGASAGAILALLCGGMILGVAARAGSRFLLLDLAGLAAATLSVVATRAWFETMGHKQSQWLAEHSSFPLGEFRFEPTMWRVSEHRIAVLDYAFAAAVIVGLVAASSAAVTRGRADIRRAHAAQSIVLASVLIGAAVLRLVGAMAISAAWRPAL